MELIKHIPIECLEDIFRHLDCEELLKCTLVCPDWNSFIGSTISCMKKIKFACLSCDLLRVRNKQIIMNSNRKYEHLCLWENYPGILMEILFEKGLKWTHVTLEMNFNTENHLLEFLGIFQSTVYKLNLTEVTIKQDENKNEAIVEPSELHFP